MASAMTVAVNITGDASGLTKAVTASNTSLKTLGTGASASTGGMTKLQGAFQKLGSVGIPVQASLALGAVALGKAMVTATSDLGESMNKVQVVFEDSAASVVNFSKSSASSLGISQAAALEAAGGFGAMLQTAGIAEAASADMSTSLVTLAADMASFNNQDPTEMLEKLRAGLAGEAEPLRTMGVFMSDAAMKAKAMELGIGSANGVLTEAQKVQARYALILEQTAKQQGDFGNTLASSFPNQMRVAKASAIDFLAVLGTAIIPILSGIVTVAISVANALKPVFAIIAQVAGVIGQGLAMALKILTPLIQPLLIGVAAIGAVLLAVLIPAFVSTAAAAIASAAAIAVAWAIPIAIAIAIGLAIMGVVKLVQAGLAALSGGWSSMSGVMKAVLIATAPLWLPIVAVIKLVQLAIGWVVKAVTTVYNAVKPFVEDFISGLVQIAGFLGDVIGWLGQAAGAVGTWIAEFAKGIPIVGDLIEIVGAIGETSAANAMAATADMRTLGLETVLAAQQGNAAILEQTKGLQALRAAMLAAGEGDKWSATMAAGLAKIDAGLKAGTIDAGQAQDAYMAYGVSLQSAQQRTAGLVQAVTQSNAAMKGAGQIAFQTADVMGRAWEGVGPKVAGSLKAITKAITQSLQAELKLGANTTKVTNRLINDYGLTADQAERTLAGASPKAMATMAKASDREFRKTGTAIQKVNHILPSTVKGFQGAGKAVDGTSKAAGAAAKSATTLTKGTEGVGKSATAATKGTTGLGKSTDGLAKDVQAAGKAGTTAAGGITKVGSSAQSGQSKVSGMVTQVSRLKTELNGLPNNITIQVTVNIKKTGASTGGVVPGLARGGVTTLTNGLPLTTVGEHGEELAALPSGTRIFSHNDTSGMLNDAMSAASGGGGGPMTISGKLTMVNGEAYIEGVVLDTLEDGRVVDAALTRRMRRP